MKTKAVDPHNCQNKGSSNLQGEHLHLFLGKAALDIFVTCAFFFFSASDIKSRVSLSFALLSWAWQPPLVCYIEKPLSFESGSQVLLKKLKFFSTKPRNGERQHPGGQLSWIKVGPWGPRSTPAPYIGGFSASVCSKLFQEEPGFTLLSWVSVSTVFIFSVSLFFSILDCSFSISCFPTVLWFFCFPLCFLFALSSGP